MGTISAKVLAEEMERVLAIRPPYDSPGTTNFNAILGGAACDCSGLPAAIFAHHGAYLYHGSNSIARDFSIDLALLKSIGQLEVGMAVYKWQETGCSREAHEKDGKGNFHHIGIVTQTNPLRIVHQSSAAGCTTVDTSISKWKYCSKLKSVTYTAPVKPDEGDDPMLVYAYKLQVTATSLIIREQPTTASAKMGSLKAGAIAYAVDKTDDGWYKLANQAGYISGHYVKVLQEVNDLDETVTTPEPTPAQPDQLTAVVNHLKEVDEQLADLIERLRKLEVDLDVGE